MLIVAIPVIIYAVVIVFYTVKWRFAASYKKKQHKNPLNVSIIIAARNEENTLPLLLNDILKQELDGNNIEIIVVDDASTDNTIKNIRALTSIHQNIKIISLKDDKETNGFKKRALAKGIQSAAYDLIITTDADCRVGKHWVKSLLDLYTGPNCKMIIGPVIYHNENNLFAKLQSLEFLALSGITGAAALAGRPVMCNGANLSFLKKAFYKVDGYNDDFNLASGDDVSLMHKFKKNWPGCIVYLKDSRAIAYTEAKNTMHEFFLQRRRWASKARTYKDGDTIFIAATVFSSCLSLVLILIFSIFSGKFAMLFLGLFLLKTCVDFIFLSSVASFFGKKNLLWLIIGAQALYIFYICFSGLPRINRKYEWKGRMVK